MEARDLTVSFHPDQPQVRQLLLAVQMEEYLLIAAQMVDKVQTVSFLHSLQGPQPLPVVLMEVCHHTAVPTEELVLTVLCQPSHQDRLLQLAARTEEYRRIAAQMEDRDQIASFQDLHQPQDQRDLLLITNIYHRALMEDMVQTVSNHPSHQLDQRQVLNPGALMAVYPRTAVPTEDKVRTVSFQVGPLLHQSLDHLQRNHRPARQVAFHRTVAPMEVKARIVLSLADQPTHRQLDHHPSQVVQPEECLRIAVRTAVRDRTAHCQLLATPSRRTVTITNGPANRSTSSSR